MKLVSVFLTDKDVEDLAVLRDEDTGMYTSRSECVRVAIREYLIYKLNQLDNREERRLNAKIAKKSIKKCEIKTDSFELTTKVLGTKEEFFKNKTLDIPVVSIKADVDNDFIDWRSGDVIK